MIPVFNGVIFWASIGDVLIVIPMYSSTSMKFLEIPASLIIIILQVEERFHRSAIIGTPFLDMD